MANFLEADPNNVSGPGLSKQITQTQVGNDKTALDVISKNSASEPMIIQNIPSQIDAFGRVRVSEPRNLFEWQFRYDSSFARYWDESTANGASTATDSNKAVRRLSIDTQASSSAILQSRRRIEYVPAKSQDVYMTFNLLGTQADADKKIGLFDDSNGLFLWAEGTDVQIAIRSAISGSVVDDPVSQADWNQDPLNGSGASGITIDWSNHQLMRITYAFLGIGDVAFSFFIDGTWRLAHVFQSANVLTGMYMQSGILPLRAEIKAIGVPAATRSMEVACVAVASEGKETDVGRVRNGNTEVTPVSIGTTESFIFGIRLSSSFPYSSAAGLAYSITPNSGNTVAIYRVYYLPTLTGATWTANTDSITEYVTNQPTFSSGLLIDSGYLNLSASGGRTQQLLDLRSDIFLGFDLSGSGDPLILTMQTLSGSGEVLFSGSWREIS